MSYISNSEIALLIEASKGYGDQLDRVDDDPQLYTDPLKLSWGEAASILKGKGYEPAEGIDYTDENFVLGYIFDDNHPEREAFLSIIDEKIPDALTGKTPGWGSVAGGTLEDMAYQAYASLPSWFQGSLAGAAKTLDHASMSWQEVDWRAWGKHMYNGDIWKASKAHKDGVERFRKNYDAGVYDKKIAGKTLLPLGRNLSIVEDIYAERSADLMKVHQQDPKNSAYWKWMEQVREKDLIPWITDNPMSAKERTAYFMSAIAAPVLTTGVGIGAYAATRDPKLAMKVAQSMSFVVEGMDEWQQSFDHYIELGYSPEMASRKSHLNAILYGAAASYIERLPMSQFLPKKSKVAVKKGIWNNLVAKSGQISDDLFKKYPSLAKPQQTIKKVLSTKSGKFIETQALRSGAEALEEGIQLTVQTAIQHGYKGGEAWEGYREELFESMRAGGLAGGGLGLAGSAAYKVLGVDSEEGPKPVTKKPEKETDIPVTRIDKDKVKVSILLRLNNKSLSDNEKQIGADLSKEDKTPESIIQSIEKKGKTILSDLSISEDQLLTALKKRFPKNPEFVTRAKKALEGEGTTTEEQTSTEEPISDPEKKSDFMTDEQILEFQRKQAEKEKAAVYAAMSDKELQEAEEDWLVDDDEVKIIRAEIERRKKGGKPTTSTTPGGARRVVKDAQGNIISEESNIEEPLEEEPIADDYDNMLKSQLQEELVNRGLAKSGNKEELKKRLRAADEVAADEETAALTQTDEAKTAEELEASLEEEAEEAGTFTSMLEEDPFATKKLKDLTTEQLKTELEAAVGIDVKILEDEIARREEAQYGPEAEEERIKSKDISSSTDLNALKRNLELAKKDVKDLYEQDNTNMASQAEAYIQSIQNRINELEQEAPAEEVPATVIDEYNAAALPLSEERNKLQDKKKPTKKDLARIEAINNEIAALLEKYNLDPDKTYDLVEEAPAEDAGEQLKINLQKVASNKFPLIQQEKEIADKIIASLKAKFPEVATIVKNILFDKDGNLIAGMSLGAVAAWSRKGASLDTPPHEYAHTLIEALIDNPIVQKAIKEYQVFDATLGRERTFEEAKEALVQDMGIYYAAKTIIGKPKGVTARLKTFLRKFWMLVKKTFGKPAEYLMEEFYTAEGLFKDIDLVEAPDIATPFDKKSSLLFEQKNRNIAAIEAIQAKYQTKLIGTTLKSITIMNNKFKTKKWQGKVTVNYSFIRALTKRVGKAERKLIALAINEEGFLDKSITTEEFKTALMKYIYPVTIERAIIDRVMGSVNQIGAPFRAYSNLTAPGGVNYGEYNINVPFDVQRAHPTFVGDNTFAWFRADESETDPTILRVNEIQSDLFQKKMWRTREVITSMPAHRIPMEEVRALEKANKFMKEMQASDWEAYLTNSILQWAADQGYSKVVFPTGETINVIEGFQDLDVQINAAKERLNRLKENVEDSERIIAQAENDVSGFGGMTANEMKMAESTLRQLERDVKQAQETLNHLLGGKDSASIVRARYNRLSNFLTNSRPGNTENITDKEGNTWTETILTDKDASTEVPLYQQLTPDSEGGKQALRLMDDALNAMQSQLGKRFSIEDFINKLAETIPSAFASVLDFWVNTHTNWKGVVKGMGNISEAYASQKEFDRTVDDVTDALEEGLINIEPNDFSVRAKNGSNIEYAFMHALGLAIDKVKLIKLMVEARQYAAQEGFTPMEAFENWADTSLYQNTGFKYSNIPDTPKGKTQKRRIKQLYVRANSMILINTKSKKPRYRSLVYNFSGDGLTWKTDTNPHTKETNSTSEQNMLYQAVKADMAWDNRPVFLRMSDIMERKGNERKSWWQKLGKVMTSDDIKTLAKKALHFEFNPEKDGIGAKIYGLVMLSTRGDSGHMIFAPILAKHKALTARLSRMELYWKDEVAAGHISKDQAYQFMGYRKNADGKWMLGKMGADTHWLAGEIARYEMMRNIMPDDIQVTGKDIGTKSSMSWMTLGSEFFRRIKIMSTPVFTSPLMKATKAVQIASNEKERSKIVFVDKNGNEGDMMRNIAGMGSKNISDGATIVSWKFADLMNTAFGTDAAKKLFKTVIWKADKSLAVKNEMFVGEMGMKIYREKEGGERELIAEMDHTGKLFSYMGDAKVEVDMLLTDDEAKHSSYDTGEVIDIAGPEMGLIKYHEAKYNKAKFPQQWLNYVHDNKVINMLQKHVLPRVERGLQRLFTLTSSSTMTPKILSKFMENLQSDSPHAITTALIEKAKLGLGLHPDAMPMLNKLLKTQIIDPTLQLAGGKGMYVDLAPDYFNTHSDNEITISQAEAKEVYKAYAKKEGGRWQDARDMGLKAINKWLESNSVRVLVSRSPIPYIGGVKVLNIKAIHDRGGQTIISDNNLIKIFEGDNDGDAVQIEFLPDELLDSIADTISKAAADNRISAIPMNYPQDTAGVNDMSLVENVYKLTQKFQAGARAIGEIANLQNVLGQLNHVFNHIETVHGIIKVHNLTDKVEFPEIGETKTLEEQLRIWIQAAVDNGKHLLLDDWGYSREKLISRLFYIADEDGNKIGELSEEALEIAMVLVREHTKPMRIRNGKSPDMPFSVRTSLDASQEYNAYTYARAEILRERFEEMGIALETIGEISFNDKLAPIEEIAIKYSEMWGDRGEPGKLNPVEFDENVYKAVHNNVMRIMKDTLDSGLQSVIAAQEAVEGKLTKTEIAEQVKRGRVWANKMWNEGKASDAKWQKSPIAAAIKAWADGKRGFVLLIEKWRGEIGPSSWDHNPDMIMFTEYWNDQFKDMTQIEQFIATHAFLQGFRQVGDKGKTHGQSNRRVLPPISDKESLTVLDPSVMREYLELYDQQLRNEDSRTKEAVAVRNEAWSKIVERIC